MLDFVTSSEDFFRNDATQEKIDERAIDPRYSRKIDAKKRLGPTAAPYWLSDEI